MEFIQSARDKVVPDATYCIGYTPSLDGLRGISILAVLGFNGHVTWLRGGFVGVDVFFVLSGFLITLLLVEEHVRTSRVNLRNFYFRRALRLLPALFALILVCVSYALLFQPAEKAWITIKGALYALFYIANWAQTLPNSAGIGALSHAWSLSVEEQFYILWPLLLLVLLRVRIKWLIFAVLGLIIAVSICLNAWLWQADTPYLRMYFGTDTRAHELLIGCVAALLLGFGLVRRRESLRWVFHSLSTLSLVIIFVSFFVFRHDEPFVYNGGFALISICTALLIVDLLLFPSRISRFFEFAPLVWIGKISYGLYLWHFPIFEVTHKFADGKVSPVLYKVSGFVITLLVATASYYLLELPFLRLKRRFEFFGISTQPIQDPSSV